MIRNLRHRRHSVIECIVLAAIILIPLLIVIASFASQGDRQQKVIKLLQRQGFTNVTLTGYRLLGCAQDDVFHDGFAATAMNGERITGVVCSGFIAKGSTIRYD